MFPAERLAEIDKLHFLRLSTDPNYGFQEKFNGERRTICRQGTQLQDWNREGERGKGLPFRVRKALLAQPMKQFVIDVELCGNVVNVLDALVLDDEMTHLEAYEYRERRCHEVFDETDAVKVVYTARSFEEKARLVIKLSDESAEGVVARDLRKPYKPGKAVQHYKYKMWKTLDAVVLGYNLKRDFTSVRLGLFDKHGKLRDICGATIKKYDLRPGMVVEVKYLYGTRDLHIVQPTLLHDGKPREDKRPEDCTIDQICVNKNFREVAA